MNPSPDRSKESLPPKKRESRQGSTDQPAPEDDFKPPAPFRSRRQHYISEAQREAVGLLPPPLPALPLPLSWELSYTPSMPASYLHTHAGDRQGPASSHWKETLRGRGAEGALEHLVPHYPHWLSSDIQPLVSVPSFKNIYTADSREMWSLEQNQSEYSSPLFNSHGFPQPALYPQETIAHRRFWYQGRRPNSVDSQERKPFNTRVPSSDHFVNDSGAKLDRQHAKYRKRLDNARKTQERCLLPQVRTSAHSSQWARNPQTLKAPSTDTKTMNAITSQDSSGGNASQAGAQIYYALGSLCPFAQPSPPAHSHLSPLVSCFQRKSQEQQNSHGVEADWESSSGPDAIPTSTEMPSSAVLPHFVKGSLIEIAGGQLKRVEELKTTDFLRSADTQPEFHLSTCTVLLISPGLVDGFNNLQVSLADRNTQELLTVLAEYPFFVRSRGWSSCSPQRSIQLYGLQCRQLSPGDECLVLTPALAASKTASSSQDQQSEPAATPATLPPQINNRPRKRRWSAPELK
ncbi:hypothetical protein DNTS_001188 [Danionella cerebrum]|uniref:AXH domain-containing protein n=1 Tax=Danionella cerebrum TaxID=2873325 RepID=A0A553Q5W7_9TELE|nr:hypothetical protein DNTS_001188 [Danionella translucida]TRY85322.1 hypothetical protein DNTS_001188 [Danionella translucida]TRY85323.1 hypothetical protein DNTS_001188 [Danionella translucida]